MVSKKDQITAADEFRLAAELTIAETRRNNAEAAKLTAEAKVATAEAERASYQAEIIHLDLLSRQRRDKSEMAKDANHHVYFFGAPVGKKSVRACVKQLTEWMRTDPGCPIEIVFNSPGGSVIEGMHLWDVLSYLKQAGHYLTTVGLGEAASMGGILLQAGDLRVLGRESYLLIHEISSTSWGKIAQMEDDLELLKKMEKRIIKILTERSNLTERRLRTMMRRKDCWLDSDECLAYGLVDELR